MVTWEEIEVKEGVWKSYPTFGLELLSLILQVSPSKVRYWISSGWLNAVKFGKVYQVSMIDLFKFVKTYGIKRGLVKLDSVDGFLDLFPEAYRPRDPSEARLRELCERKRAH